jgi:hypothetical protein
VIFFKGNTHYWIPRDKVDSAMRLLTPESEADITSKCVPYDHAPLCACVVLVLKSFHGVCVGVVCLQAEGQGGAEEAAGGAGGARGQGRAGRGGALPGPRARRVPPGKTTLRLYSIWIVACVYLHHKFLLSRR